VAHAALGRASHPLAAQRLTDAPLAALLARVGGALECVELVGRTGITARGVAAALRQCTTTTPLTQLAVRGVKSAPEDGEVYALLRALVRERAGLDVDRHAACSALDEEGAPCARLCLPNEELCSICHIFHCAACMEKPKRAVCAPCVHECDV
jgi:hypothetical protein